mgnify:CR=1 FL=1
MNCMRQQFTAKRTIKKLAEKIFEKVFMLAYTNNNSFPVRSHLMSLIDMAHERSCKTVKALAIFSACCSGASISISEKKITN